MGFDPDRVLTVSISPPPTRYREQARRAEFWERVGPDGGPARGAQRFGATSGLPLLPGNSTRGLVTPTLPADAQPGADYRTASPDYFAVMRIPVLRGRAIEASDREDRPAVAVISSSAAQRFWPGRDPIGQHFQINVPGP